jgi:hypothetical protein
MQIAAAQNALNSGRTPQSLWPQNWQQLYTGTPGLAVPPSPGKPGVPGYAPGVGYVDAKGNPTGAPGLPTSAPSGEGFAPQPHGTPVMGAAPPSFNGGGGGIGMTPGGTLETAMNLAAGGLDLMAPGAGQAASTGMKLANRAIQQMGQYAGIGASGLMETFIPFGGSELANNNWLTRIVGGLAGVGGALPNMAGKAAAQPQKDPNAAQPGVGTGPPPGPQVTNNINVTNQRANEDGTGRDIQRAMAQYPIPGQR